MFIEHDSFGNGSNHDSSGQNQSGPWRHDLPDDAALLLWSIRRMVVAWPRCHAVHVALYQRWPETSLGIEHLLRCWLTALCRHAERRLTLGDPNCALVHPDETLMLFALTHAGVDGTEVLVEHAISRLTGTRRALCLVPLATALQQQINCRPGD